MNAKNLRPLALATLCLAAAFALAVGSAPCVTTYPKCDLTKNGAQCGGGTSTISFGDEQNLGYYYCGGNSTSRCNPHPAGTCSELMYLPGTAREVFCGDTSLGFCMTSAGSPFGTGYDCSSTPQPCPDVPNPTPPNIVGQAAPCNTPGVECLDLQGPSTPGGS